MVWHTVQTVTSVRVRLHASQFTLSWASEIQALKYYYQPTKLKRNALMPRPCSLGASVVYKCFVASKTPLVKDMTATTRQKGTFSGEVTKLGRTQF